jgi:glycosyltransferase involved in cell wall biosynthesis
MAAPFRLLVVSHAADGTGAPISTLALCRAWADRGDVELKISLRRDGPLRPEFEAIAETFVFRAKPKFGLVDSFGMMAGGKPLLALKGLRNPDRPYILSSVEKKHSDGIRWAINEFDPQAVYVSTTHCGDALEPMNLSAPILTHVREMEGVIASLDKERRESALRRSSAFAAVSEPVQQTLIDSWGVPAAKIQIEAPAIEVQSLEKRADEAAEISLPDAPYIVGIGSLIERKGPDIFLEVAARAARANLSYKFIWMGDGPMAFLLQEAAEKMGLTNLTWAGQVKNPYPILKQAKALALTSREDPHPRTMIEAAALGVPTNAFKGAGGADSFLPSNNAGQLVPMEDAGAMLTAISDADSAFSTPSIKEKYDVKNSAARLLDRLKALAA